MTIACTSRVSRWALLLAVAVCALLPGAPARAHLKFNPLDTGRYVKLEPSATSIRLAYSVGPGARPAAALRREMDKDGNGRISDAESRAWLDVMAAEVASGLLLVVDGVAVHPAFSERHIGLGSDVVAAVPFAVDLVETVPLAPAPPTGSHSIVIDDTTAFPDPGEVEIRVEEDISVELVRAHLGGRPASSLRNVVYASVGGGDLGVSNEFLLEFRVRPGYPETASDSGSLASRIDPTALAAAVVYLVAVGAWGWRRRHRRADSRRTDIGSAGND